jgi:hypothetical protein
MEGLWSGSRTGAAGEDLLNRISALMAKPLWKTSFTIEATRSLNGALPDSDSFFALREYVLLAYILIQ